MLPTLAKEVGVNEAIVLQQIHYWSLHKVRQGEEDWVYNTQEDWLAEFPWLSLSTFQRVIRKLRDDGLLEIRQPEGTNRRAHYRVSYVNLPGWEHVKLTASTRQFEGLFIENRDINRDNPSKEPPKNDPSASKSSPPTQPAVVVSKKTAAIEEVWAGYVHWLKPRRTEMDPESRKLIVDALKVAEPAELVACMEACARSDWHQKRGTEKNRPGGKYNKLPQIIKARRGRPETTRSRIEWWLDRLEAMNEGKSPSMDENAYVEQVRREQGLDG